MSLIPRRLTFAAVQMVSALICVGVLGSAANAADKMFVRLEYSWWTVHAAFFIPMDKGWYKGANLDVSVDQGKGSSSTAVLVGSGAESIGFGDAGAAAQVISRGSPMKVAGVFWQSGPSGLLCRKGVALKQPSDIEGATIGASPGGANGYMLNAFIAKNGLQKDKINIENMTESAQNAALFAGKVQCISTDIYLIGNEMSKAGLPFNRMLYADHGVPQLSNTIMVRDAYLAEHADVIRRFLAVFSRGYQYMLDHPDEAHAILHKHAPDAMGDLALDRTYIGIMKRQVHTPASQGKPLGWSAKSDWTGLVDMLHAYAGLANPKPAAVYYTNEYLPKE